MNPCINFVVSNWQKWEFAIGKNRPSLDSLAGHFISSEDIWVAQTYFQLSARGHPVSISSTPETGKVNIVDGISFQPTYFTPDMFCVGCRSDGLYPAFCQVVIHQNSLVSDDEPSIYLPQWPQPGIIARDESRNGVSTIAFFGHAKLNLAQGFRQPEFMDELRRHGSRLMIRGKSDIQVMWNDYSTVDLVLAVREIPSGHLRLKPVNKLTNAWLAGVPALIGPEPAVEAIRESPLDYFQVDEPRDVFKALQIFKDDPATYRRMVEHGRSRSSRFNEEAVATCWEGAMDSFRRKYEEWAGMSPAEQVLDYQRRAKGFEHQWQLHWNSVHREYARRGFASRWWETPDTE